MTRTRFRRRRVALLVTAVTAAVLGTAYASPKKASVDQEALSRAIAFETALTQVAESVSPSVVSIKVEVTRPQQMGFPMPFFGMPDRGGIVRGGGSGVILRSDGYILTNNHVVREATRIDVTLQNGESYLATLIGADPPSDLAVLKIDATGLKQADFASSQDARVGQLVIAIGSPFGLDYTVTTGVLSAKGRGGIGANEIEDYLQTDASINPGNSGGPLVDLNGDVLGINTMIIGRGSGIGFAIPSEIAQRVAKQLIQHGAMKRAWLGVSFQEITPELASHFGGDFDGGALINGVVPEGPADKAGLKAGDVVVAVGDIKIREGHDLLRTVLRHEVGERLTLKVRRGNTTRKVKLVTGERPSGDAAQAKPKGSDDSDTLGLSLQEITPMLRQRFGYEGEGRVFVRGVQPGSDADRAGLQPGDIILQADQRPVQSAADVQLALRDGKALLYVERESRRFFQSIGRSK
ncbi:MAG: trypsin-like peptidase domain-containing protein [Myxococcales bacterium]|nr:trypsin-like peptidase domain-containing protein [Myxococcales bacterium]MDH3842319.1 trypsin-like peptidase domain-containing protein [Myxococcales bacterium]